MLMCKVTKICMFLMLDFASSPESNSGGDTFEEPEPKHDLLNIIYCIFDPVLRRIEKSYAVKLWNLNGQLCSPVLISILPV